MAIDLIPAGSPYAACLGAPASLVVSKVWLPHDPPREIGPGELDAVTTAKNRIYWQWQEGPKWQALAGIVGLGGQGLVSEQYQIATYRYLSTGFGQILDELGAPVGLDRMGLAEEVYRLAIRVRGASLTSDAGIDAVTTPVKQLLGEDAVTYMPAYPAAFWWVISIPVSPSLLELLLELLPPLVGQGIGASIVLAPPESPGWDWSPGETWAASWSSVYGAVDASVASPWGWSVSVG